MMDVFDNKSIPHNKVDIKGKQENEKEATKTMKLLIKKGNKVTKKVMDDE